MPEMNQPASTWTMQLPDYRIKVDPQRAKEVGLTPDSIAEQAYYALSGGLTAEYYRLPNLRQNTIQVRYGEGDRAGVQDLENLYLSTPTGRQIPLKSVATIQYDTAPTVIEHDGLRRVVGVTGYYPLESSALHGCGDESGGEHLRGQPEVGHPPDELPARLRDGGTRRYEGDDGLFRPACSAVWRWRCA